MPIPPYSLDGILPPFMSSIGPGGSPNLMSPYKVTVNEIISHFATSDERKIILAGWLEYREALRGIGITRGFQWLDGSFVEDKETIKGVPPNDLDLVVFFRRPTTHKTNKAFKQLADANRVLFDRYHLKFRYHLDAFPIDLDGNPETIVSTSRYFLQLFSHQRDTSIWKGMLQVQQDDDKDDAVLLASLTSTVSGGGP